MDLNAPIASIASIVDLWESTFDSELLSDSAGGETLPVMHRLGQHSALGGNASTVTIDAMIGTGGSAEVFSGHQGSLRREVAVKQLRNNSQRGLLQRFRHEAWLTAGLNHPNILPIHDLININGRPSLVMKRIQGKSWGESLSEAFGKPSFDLAVELQRLIHVCDAVAFAHSRGVVHLDLKFANVMCGAFGETLVMDWGCAALFEDSLWKKQPDLPRTKNIAYPLGTPNYMAPELARGDGEAIGSHTDVYLLGAMLYALLSGRTLRKGDNVRQTISLAVKGSRKALPKSAPPLLAKLCWRATEPDISTRMSSVSLFRSALQNWLDTRESRQLTANALSKLASLEQQEMLTEAQRQEGAQLLGVFEQAGRSGAQLPEAIEGEWAMRVLLANNALRNGSPAVARILSAPLPKERRLPIEKSAQTLHAQQSQTDDTDAWLKTAMSKDGGKSIEPVLQRVYVDHKTLFGAEHPNTIGALENMASLYREQGRFSRAETLFERSLDLHAQVLGHEHLKTLQSTTKLAMLYQEQGRYEQAESLFVRALNIGKRTLGEEHATTVSCMNSLGVLYYAQGRYAEAEPLYQQIIQIQTKLVGEDHMWTLISINNLALLYYRQNRHREAEVLFRMVLDSKTRTLGPSHASTLVSMNNLALLHTKRQQYDQAEQLLLTIQEHQMRTLGLKHPKTLTTISNLALVYQPQKRYSEARTLLERVLDINARNLGEEHPNTITNRKNLAVHMVREGKPEQAEPLMLAVVSQMKAVVGIEHPMTLDAMCALGGVYMALERYSEAESWWLETMALSKRILGEGDALVKAVAERLEKLDRVRS